MLAVSNRRREAQSAEHFPLVTFSDLGDRLGLSLGVLAVLLWRETRRRHRFTAKSGPYNRVLPLFVPRATDPKSYEKQTAQNPLYIPHSTPNLGTTSDQGTPLNPRDHIQYTIKWRRLTFLHPNPSDVHLLTATHYFLLNVLPPAQKRLRSMFIIAHSFHGSLCIPFSSLFTDFIY